MQVSSPSSLSEKVGLVTDELQKLAIFAKVLTKIDLYTYEFQRKVLPGF